VQGEGQGEGMPWARREALEALTKLIAPMVPHLAEEAWQRLGHTTLLAESDWPEHDPALAKEETITVGVQVNGKLRGTIDLPRDAASHDVEEAALALPQVARFLDGKPPKKVVVVPNRIVSVVA